MAADILSLDQTSSVASKEGTTSPSPEKDSKGAPKKPRQKRPNYHEIHSKPLPLEVCPLPAFIPHNPISIVRIAIAILSHSFWRPKSHETVHRAYFSPETQSIHVTDARSIRAMWEQGFWGKGSLSRSEPQWLIQERRRRGIEGSKTSAEVTKARREERKQFKLERAKAQREAIEQQQRDEGKLDPEVTIDELVEDGKLTESPKGTLYTPNAGDALTINTDHIVAEVEKTLATETLDWGNSSAAFNDQETEIKDEEHLQLTLEEAFFLTYVLGAINVYNNNSTTILTSSQLLRLCCTHSIFPLSSNPVKQSQTPHEGFSNCHYQHTIDALPIAPDNPFLLKYVVFHHFRSLGWVVRPGIKFAVDYLLYLRGPAFHHAEFAIMIVPSYSHSYWSDTPEGLSHRKDQENRDWWWLHRMNRVQTQVMKTLILVYVEIPPPWDLVNEGEASNVDIGNTLSMYKVREFVCKRWSPSRNRD